MILYLNNTYKKTLQLKKLNEIRRQLTHDANKIAGLTPEEIEKKTFNKKYASNLNLQSANDFLNYKKPKLKFIIKNKIPKYNTRKRKQPQIKIPKIKVVMKTLKKKNKSNKTLKMK